jgi:hypothetical protein
MCAHIEYPLFNRSLECHLFKQWTCETPRQPVAEPQSQIKFGCIAARPKVSYASLTLAGINEM